MKGKVEVFAIAADGSERLVLSEPNLVVNGAGESIVDMLTTPSSVLGIAPRVMDTSNWRFGALSFGPAAGSFSGNAYFFPEEIDGVRVYNKEDDLCNGVSSNVTSWFNQICTDHKLRVLWASATIGEANGATASAYTPPYRLPSYPDPLDQKLEDASTTYSLAAAASGATIESFGQFENRIQFASDDASSYFQGAYARNVDATGNDDLGTSAMLVSSYEGDFQADTSANIIIFENKYGPFNRYFTMDYRGFITIQYHSRGGGESWGRVTVSGSEEVADGGAGSNDLTGTTSQCAQPLVTLTTSISGKDAWMMNNYGGLHQIGLWNMNTPKAILSNAPPFLEGDPNPNGDPKFINDSTGVTKQEYKLFAKKTFTDNLVQNRERSATEAGYQNVYTLKLQWTIDFRSQHD